MARQGPAARNYSQGPSFKEQEQPGIHPPDGLEVAAQLGLSP